jgi:hypothetical protein
MAVSIAKPAILRKNSDKLQLHPNLGLVIGPGVERNLSLQRDAPEMADEVHPAVGLEVHQHLIHGSDGAINFNLQAASFFPRFPRAQRTLRM